MHNSLILSYTTFIYFAAFMVYLLGMVMNRSFFSRLGHVPIDSGAHSPNPGHHSQMDGVL